MVAAAAAGRAAAASGAAGGRAAAGRSAAARRPRARTIDERSQRAADRFGERWSRPGAAEKKGPKAKAPSQQGLMDAVAAGGEKAPSSPSASETQPSRGQGGGGGGSPRGSSGGSSVVSSGAGAILAVLFWSWVALPFLKGGPAGVRNMLRAKFTNKAPDGSWLP